MLTNKHHGYHKSWHSNSKAFCAFRIYSVKLESDYTSAGLPGIKEHYCLRDVIKSAM